MTPTLLLALCARPLLHGYAIRRFRRHRDLLSSEEIRSIVDEGILEACRRFDPTKGPFVPFARFWVRRQVQRAVAHELVWQRQRVGEGDLHFDELVEGTDTDERLEEQVVAKVLISRLEPGVQDFWSMHASGRSIRELASAYGLSIRQVRHRLARVWDTLEPDGGGRTSPTRTSQRRLRKGRTS